MTKVLNFFSGPGAGKSTLAAGLFHELKKKNINCELVREYAKDVVWEGRIHLLENQIYIFAKQLKRQVDLKDKVDYIITDSPLFLSLYYADNLTRAFENLVLEEYNKFDNINYFVNRTKEYNPAGRLQTEKEAMDIDFALKCLMTEYRLLYKEASTVEEVLKLL